MASPANFADLSERPHYFIGQYFSVSFRPLEGGDWEGDLVLMPDVNQTVSVSIGSAAPMHSRRQSNNTNGERERRDRYIVPGR